MPPSTPRPTALVVGAGIAGLTAAYRLARAGIQVKVLEASDRVGGRMSSDRVNGHIIDRGAQFLSSEYSLLLSLAKESGCAPRIHETSRWNAIVRDGIPRAMRGDNPMDALTSGLLNFPSWIRLGWRTWQSRDVLQRVPLNDYSQWAGFDTEDTATWCDRAMDAPIKEFIFEPMLQGFYFQSPEETSRALAWVLAAFGYRRARTLTCADGIGTLPEALAMNLDITFNTTVHSIHIGQDVTVATSAGDLRSDFAVLAVPASAASRLYSHEANELERYLMGTPYSSSINVMCLTTQAFRLPEHLQSVYGLLIPRQERQDVVAITIERNKRREGSDQGQVLNIMVSNDSARRMMPLPDEAIVQCVLREAGRYFPGLEAQLETFRVYRWPEAEPLSKVGRANALQRYPAQCQTARPRVLLAGDYMSMPYTEGAAESGAWAARLAAEGDAQIAGQVLA
jgi:protoporphyrinogen/coproporphyrinogen III oxidase